MIPWPEQQGQPVATSDSSIQGVRITCLVRRVVSLQSDEIFNDACVVHDFTGTLFLQGSYALSVDSIPCPGKPESGWTRIVRRIRESVNS